MDRPDHGGVTMDTHWLAECIKNLTMEIATLRGEAQRQITERDKTIAELQEKLKAKDEGAAE